MTKHPRTFPALPAPVQPSLAKPPTQRPAPARKAAGSSRGARTASQAPSPVPQAGMQLHTAEGARKYLTSGERNAFLKAAEQAGRETRTLCMTLAYADCPRRSR